MQRRSPKMLSHLGVDSCHIVNEGPRGGADPKELYPDFDYNKCWTLTGTWGAYGLEVRGRHDGESRRRFETPTEAANFYAQALGVAPLEKESWGFGSGKGGRWGLRFRGSRPDSIPLPPPLEPAEPREATP